MPWKLVSFLFTLIIATLFIGFNLENRCDVSFIFYTFTDVPIFVSLLFAYVMGALMVIPFFWAHRLQKKRRTAASAALKGSTAGKKGKTAAKTGKSSPSYPDDYDID